MSRRIIAYFFLFLLGGLGFTYWPVAVEQAKESSAVTLIGGPMVQLGKTDGQTSMVVAWRTAEASTSLVEYGPTAHLGSRVADHALTTHHALELPNLESSSHYHYRVISNNKILAQAIFQTGKTAEQPFKFAVFGDSGSGKTSQYEVAAQIEKHKVDFILHTGDVVYPSGEDEFYRARFYQPYKDILARSPIFPVLGNHDYKTDNGKPWVDNFCLPGEERYYSFDYANAHFIALDSYRIDATSAAWLERDLKRAAKLWKVVVFHEPPFSNKSGRTGSAGARRLWLPLFEKYKVDLVFSGHDHMYTRFKPRGGVVYIVEGLGGNTMNKINRDAGHVDFTDNTRFGFGLVEVAGRKLIFRHITAGGAVLDTLTLVKPAAVAAPAG